MGVGLQPLEFTECLADSPHFRENLQRHEKELERTSQQIKRLIKEVKDVVQAAKRLGVAQRALAASMEQFEFACIGASMTEDERVIGRSLHHFAHLISTIEDERDRMLGRADVQIIQPLEKFRKEHIGAVKEGKKKFDKKTAKFCQTQERTLSLSTKKQENVFQEADAAMDMAERDFCQASLEYVFQLQAVQERKKFELVETLLGFVFGWWTFHHTAHDVHADAEPRVKDLQLRIQRVSACAPRAPSCSCVECHNRVALHASGRVTLIPVADAEQLRGDQQADGVAHEEDDGGAPDEQGGGGRRGGRRRLQGGLPLPHGEKGVRHDHVEQAVLHVRAQGARALADAVQPDERARGRRRRVRVRVRVARVRRRARAPLLLGGGARGARPRARAAHAAGALGRGPRRLDARARRGARRARRRAPRAPRAPRAARVRARRRRLRVRAPAGGRDRGARPRGAGPVPRGGRLVEGGAAGGRRAPPAARPRRPARVGDQDAHLRAQGLPARAARPAAHAPPARRLHRGGQVRAAQRARAGRGGAGARAAAAQPRDAAPGDAAPAQRRRPLRQEPDVRVELGGVLRAHAAAPREGDGRLHPRPQVLQRGRRDAAAPLPGGVRGRRRRARPRRPHPRPTAPQRPRRDVPDADADADAGGGGAGLARRHQRGRSSGRGRGLGRGRGRALLLPAPSPAAAALRAATSAAQSGRGQVEQQQRRVGVEPGRVAAGAGGGGAGGGGGGAARAHAVRVPRRERGRALVRAEPDHHERVRVRGARLAARHPQREGGARARELRGAAALSHPRTPPHPQHTKYHIAVVALRC